MTVVMLNNKLLLKLIKNDGYINYMYVVSVQAPRVKQPSNAGRTIVERKDATSDLCFTDIEERPLEQKPDYSLHQ